MRDSEQNSRFMCNTSIGYRYSMARMHLKRCREAAVRVIVALRYDTLIAFVILTTCFPIFIHRQSGFRPIIRGREIVAILQAAEKMPLTSLQMKVSPKPPWS